MSESFLCWKAEEKRVHNSAQTSPLSSFMCILEDEGEEREEEKDGEEEEEGEEARGEEAKEEEGEEEEKEEVSPKTP